MDDWEIAQDIKNELWWSRFVDKDHIAVSVLDGVATLTGEVDSLRERHAVTANAYEGCAKQVCNRLKVKYGPAAL